MVEAVGYVPLGGHVRIGVAIFSYDGALTFGVTGDYDTAADIERALRGHRELARRAARELPAGPRRAAERAGQPAPRLSGATARRRLARLECTPMPGSQTRRDTERLAAMERGSATDGEARASRVLAGMFAERGLEPTLEREQAVGGFWQAAGIASGGGRARRARRRQGSPRRRSGWPPRRRR